MKVLNINNEDVKIFAETLEDSALAQIEELAGSQLATNAHIRIMPDCHSGAGCVIGTTMRITDKVCPDLVGVDIGCGVFLAKTNMDFNSKDKLEDIDYAIRKYIPFGMKSHDIEKQYDFSSLKCFDYIKNSTKQLSQHALGTLGGGNHFIEAYNNGWISIHSGSRNMGLSVANYWQNKAQEYAKKNNIDIPKHLSYLEGEEMMAYLHDVSIMQQFATDNKRRMLEILSLYIGFTIEDEIDSIHNYIECSTNILRKGAISAKKNELLVIPLNMRDGILICKGKGNEDWNYSAPHGAGRLYSRTKAKKNISMEDYRDSMDGIYSSCICKETLDEAPFAYKNSNEIINSIEPTVEIIDHLFPIFNFKAN